MKFLSLFSLIIFTSLLMAADCNQSSIENEKQPAKKVAQKDLSKYSTAVFASGCFWCVEAIFESVEGVAEAISGYSGGKAADANYKAVSAGYTDHAEAVEVYYDPQVVNYETLLKVFFGSHDPTTLNRQGPDSGTQYRSAIFYKDETELKAIEKYIAELKSENVFDGTITTEIAKLEKFYPAEDYHQDFERRNPNQGYVRAVSIPRLKKFQKKFPKLLKKDSH